MRTLPIGVLSPLSAPTLSHHQGDRERDLGLPVAPMYDRTTANVASTQMNFAEYLAFPLFLILIEIFPALEPVGRYLTSNIGHWATIRAHELRGDFVRGRKDGARLPPGVDAEITALLARGPAVDQMLTDALKSKIVLK